MTGMLLVAIGASAGAGARFFLTERATQWFGSHFPIGTLLVNLSGSFLLGVIATIILERYGGDHSASLLLATGFLGAYTTFSTFSLDTVRLIESGAGRSAITNIVVSTGGGVLAAALGVLLGLAVT